MTDIEEPDCQIGYTWEQAKRIVGGRLDEFQQWMAGQTVALCDGRRYDHDKREHEPTGCGPHGMAVYPWDLKRFLRGGPILD